MGSFTQSDAALEWRGGHETVRIEPWGRNSLRIRGTLGQGIRDDLPGALLPSPSAGGFIDVSDGRATITHGGLTAEISGSGQLRFLGADGRELLSETTPHFTGPPTRRYAPAGGGSHHFEVLFNARDGERFYGLGQHQHGRLNQKGAVVELVQRNTEVSIPFLVSNLGYGLLWNHPGIGRVELGVTVTRWVSESTRQWDYWITAAAAMIEDGPWIFPELNAAGWKYNKQYGIVKIPTQTAGGTVVAPLGGETWNIGNSGSAQQQNAAWEWIKGAQAPSVMTHVTSLMYYLPTKPAVISQYLKGGPEYTVFAKETATARSRTTQYGSNYPKVSQALWTAIQAAITGTSSVSSALTQAQSTISSIPQVKGG